jgi:hypothetical protein
MRTPAVRATGRRLPVAAAAMARKHAAFLVLLLTGAVLRALVFVGFRPALWFLGDSAAYLQAALDRRPAPERPIAGSFVWSLLHPLHRLEAITVVQHVSGLLITVAVYALLLRLGAPRWAAVLGAAPMALDGLVVTLEQSLVAEPLFMALGVAAARESAWSSPSAWCSSPAGSASSGCWSPSPRAACRCSRTPRCSRRCGGRSRSPRAPGTSCTDGSP